jgi:hypothetical protein
VVVKKPTPSLSVKAKPTPMASHTTRLFPPVSSVSAITTAPKNMQGINDQQSLFSGGMDPAFVTLGPKTGSRPELGSYAGKIGVNFEIGLGKPILAPIDARFIGFNNRNSEFRNGMDETLQVPFDDLELCFESTSSDWPGPLRAEGWQFFTENDYAIPSSSTSLSCQALLGRTVKRGDVIAYSGTVGNHLQAPIIMKVPDKSINPTVKSGDKNLHWVQGDVFFYWKCFGKDVQFEQGVLAYPWGYDGYTAPAEEQSVDFKYSK